MELGPVAIGDDKVEHATGCAAFGYAMTQALPREWQDRHPVGARLVCLALVARLGAGKEDVDNRLRDHGTPWARDDTEDLAADLVGGVVGIEIGRALRLPHVSITPRLERGFVGVVLALNL